jgi:16S rRNA (cytidine1402-2'-O)-methyltransferase
MHPQSTGILYLFPNFLDDSNTVDQLPAQIIELAGPINNYIGETEKKVRSFVKKILPSKAQSDLKIELLNEHNADKDVQDLIKPLLKGEDMALVSDAGMPCIADPGHQVVRLCHAKNIKVVPIAGPSSILLTLVASGFTGQQFTFHGYLPYDKTLRQKKLKQMEIDAIVRNYTQLFMEAPYRNNQLLKELMEICDDRTVLSAGIALTSTGERIITQSISQWKREKINLHKIPVMWSIGK